MLRHSSFFMTHKNSTKKSGLKPKKGDTESIPSNGMNQKKMIEASENSVNSAECLNRKITTKNLCSLQIQRQIEINDKSDMKGEMYLNCLTEDEFDEKTESLLNLSFCKWLPYQKEKMKKVIASIKENGWFERFDYKDHQCAVELDDSGKWRIYVRPEPTDFLEFHASNFEFDYHTSSARFSVPKFELGVWWYGDKIGLDDFVGLQIFSYISWNRYFSKEERKYCDRTEFQILTKEHMKNMCKRLVDAIADYQITIENEKKWMCSICKIEYNNDTSAEQKKKHHEEFHKVASENVKTGEVFWEVLV